MTSARAVLRVRRLELEVAQRRQQADEERRRDQVGAQVRDVLPDDAVVAEDDVLVGAVGAAAGVDVRRRGRVAEDEAGAREVAVQRVLAGGEVVARGYVDAGARSGSSRLRLSTSTLMPGVAVDLVDAAAADDQVVARAAREEVAGLAAVDHVVAAGRRRR